MRSSNRIAVLLPVSLLVSLGLTACSGNRGPEPLPPLALAPAPSGSTSPEADAGSTEGSSETPKPIYPEDKPAPRYEDDPTIKVIEGEKKGDGDKVSLAEYSRRERQRRARAEGPTTTIDDENLGEHATGQFTFTTGTGQAESAVPDELMPGGRGEEDWKHEILSRRTRWRERVDEILRLETDVARLRDDFYSTDDGFYRDQQIKPEWDRKLERLQEAREEASEAEASVAAFLSLAAREGVPASWMREGMEIEPAERPYSAPEDPEARRARGEPDVNEGLIGEPEAINEYPNR